MEHDPPLHSPKQAHHGNADVEKARVEMTEETRTKQDEMVQGETSREHRKSKASTQPLPSPAASANSGTTSNPTSSTSSRAPRLVSDEGSSPSSGAFRTPDNTSNLDPFSSLTLTAIPDGLPPIGEDASAALTPGSNPPSRPLPSNLLTSESLRPLDNDVGKGSGVSTPSVSSTSEKYDRLGPLPSARPQAPERPSMNRSSTSPRQTLSPRSQAPSRIPMPSPPAMGLSELMTGGSPIATPNTDQGYFTGAMSEPGMLTRSGSGRRTPHYSPFRSYYGPTIDQRRAEAPGEGHVRSATSPGLAYTEFDSLSQASRTSGESRGERSPRIKNNGGILAPHGSFTTAKRPGPSKRASSSSTASGTRQPGPVSDSQLYVGMRKMDLSEGALAAQAERDALEAAARKGDQLAMYRLGWKGEAASGQRYKIGSIEDVWGPVSPSSTTRSSFSSRGSVASISTTTQERPDSSRRGTPTSQPAADLFTDAAALALRDTASRNRSASHLGAPGRPNPGSREQVARP